MDAQSEAASQRTDVPTTREQEAHVTAPSAATVAMVMTGISAILLGYILLQRHQTGESSRQTGTIGPIGTVSGSQSPIIAGSGPVTINQNLPPEIEGVHAAGPQNSQIPDQEPKPGAPSPSYRDIGNKIREILKTTCCYVPLSLVYDNDQMHIAGIYTKVQLKTREGVAFVTPKLIQIVNSTEYAKIFRLTTRTGELIERVIFFGMGGVGKSTIFYKIAYDWAHKADEILEKFELVLLLKMCDLLQESDLVDSAVDQLVGKDLGITKNELHKFIQDNPNKVLILLDGFDEMETKELNADSFGSILQALNRKVYVYRECFICISARTSHLQTLMLKTLVKNPCTHVEVVGFTDDDVAEYVRKFYDADPDSGNALIQTIRESNTLSDVAQNPMLLLLMCLMRSNKKQAHFSKTTSRLFAKAVDHMFTRKDEDKKRASKANETVISIGQPALRGIMSAIQPLSFQKTDFEPIALHLALKAGILTQESVIDNIESHKIIRFMNKTIQEYCAAKYLQSIHMSNWGFVKRMVYKLVPFGEFKNNLEQLCHTVEGVVSNDFLLRFCCGDNVMCMTDIVQLLDRNFMHPSRLIEPIIRNYIFESQSEKVPQCLTIDSLIPSTIVVRTNNNFCSLAYFLKIICKLNSCTAQLAHVVNIQVSWVFSVRDFAFALGYMENLTCLRLSYCPLVEGDLKEILSSLKRNKLLTRLSIWDCNKVGGRAEEWAPCINDLKSLNKLEIRDCKLQGTDIEHIVSAVANMPGLTDLILNGNNALCGSTALWARELPKMEHLKRLDLSRCDLTMTDIEHIASALPVHGMPRLTDLILDGNWELGGLDEIQARFPSLGARIKSNWPKR